MSLESKNEQSSYIPDFAQTYTLSEMKATNKEIEYLGIHKSYMKPICTKM